MICFITNLCTNHAYSTITIDMYSLLNILRDKFTCQAYSVAWYAFFVYSVHHALHVVVSTVLMYKLYSMLFFFFTNGWCGDMKAWTVVNNCVHLVYNCEMDATCSMFTVSCFVLRWIQSTLHLE